MRAGYNTGFRAPALQQVQYRQITLLPTSSEPRYSGISNNQSEVAAAADTRTQGLGFVATYRRPLGRGSCNVSLAANDSRTTITQLRVPEAFQDLQKDGLPGNDYIDQRQLPLIRTGNPRQKLILSTRYDIGKLSLLMRNFYSGKVESYDFNLNALPEGSSYMVFHGKTSTDLTASYRPAKRLQLTAGGNNLFNIYPDNISRPARSGRAPDGFASLEEYTSYYQSQNVGKTINLPYDYDILPYQAQQMPLAGRYFYLKAAYSLGGAK
ncbi:TonB-dependent receptor domain-containing protein [Hymenobacter psychrophilus]|uniref:TonB dependent receptor n=1 Tax=Hymenobacter psychrophilus TaxID=651662 RepID=A0A1H3MJC6_9BACT|nr:TonB-dependent receptor [Hymenobacter psychrophilus]SDY76812.1 TonB dependent receptor [Hymenobacter psychrophilus]